MNRIKGLWPVRASAAPAACEATALAADPADACPPAAQDHFGTPVGPDAAGDIAHRPAPPVPRLAPRGLPQRRTVDMRLATGPADEAVRHNDLEEARRRLVELARNHPNQTAPLVRLVALGLRTGQSAADAEQALARLCPAPAERALAWLHLYGDQAQTHSDYRCSLASILSRFADALGPLERHHLLTRVQTPSHTMPRPLLMRTLTASRFGDAMALEALLSFAPSFWHKTPASLDAALHDAVVRGAKAVLMPLLAFGARPKAPQALAVRALHDQLPDVFAEVLRIAPEVATMPLLLTPGDLGPVTLVQAALELCEGDDAVPFIELLHAASMPVLDYPKPSGRRAPWQLAMLHPGRVMHTFLLAVPSLDAVDPHTGRTLLMDAAMGDYPWAVHALLAGGADASLAHIASGRRALDYAMTQGHKRCVDPLKHPTQTRHMLRELLHDNAPEEQTEIVGLMSSAAESVSDAWRELLRRLLVRHGATRGAALGIIVMQTSQNAAPADIMAYEDIAAMAPSTVAADTMLVALASRLAPQDVGALCRAMRRHLRAHHELGRAMYGAICQSVIDAPQATSELLRHIRSFALQSASDADVAGVLHNIRAVMLLPCGLAAWPEAEIARCLEPYTLGQARAYRLSASLSETYRRKQALMGGPATLLRVDSASEPRWRRTLLPWTRRTQAKAVGAKLQRSAHSAFAGAFPTAPHAAAAAERTEAAEETETRRAALTVLHAATVRAGHQGPMFVDGPSPYALADVQAVAQACQNEDVLEAFDDSAVAEAVLGLLEAMLGAPVVGRMFMTDAAMVPDARPLRPLFRHVHPDRAPKADDTLRHDALTALLGEIYGWLKDAARCRDAAVDPTLFGAPLAPSPLVVAFDKTRRASAA